MKKKLKKGIASTLVILLCFGMIPSSVAMAKQNVVDTQGETYKGAMSLATNTNFEIDSDEAYFNNELPTGETDVNQDKVGTLGREGLDGFSRCGTMELPKVNVDVSAIKEKTATEPKKTYAEGDTKELSLFLNAKGDIKKHNCTCLAVGTHCTIWYDENNEANKRAAENLMKQFDDYYSKMVKAFGSPKNIDVDNDGKVAVVVGSIKKEFEGYFWAADLYRENEEMDRINLNSDLDDETKECFDFILCHEFQHLINFSTKQLPSDSWLDEVFSENAPIIAGVPNAEKSTYTNHFTDYISRHKRTMPFVLKGDYTPSSGEEAMTIYGQWFLFGRYLVAQTIGYKGGGNAIYKTILSTKVPDDEHPCTRENLIKTLENMGILGEYRKFRDFEDLVNSYNIALVLQKDSGIYGFEGLDITNFKFPIAEIGATLPKTLPGGGAMAVALSRKEGSFTPEGAATSMRFAGIDLNVPDKVISNHEYENALIIGETLELSAEDGMTIYYTSTNDESEPKNPTITNSEEYKEPIIIDENINIKAIAYDKTEQTTSEINGWSFIAVPEAAVSSHPSGRIKEG